MQSKLLRSFAAIALAALAAGTAQARDNVTWSVGIEAAPGVASGATNARPLLAPAPVYVAPQPVYVAPQPVYVAPRPRPVVVVEEPVYVVPGRHRGWHKHHHHAD